MTFRWLGLGFLACALVACGDDDGPATPPDGGGGADSGGMDGGGADGGGTDGGAELVDCTGMADGASCGEGFICFAEVCLRSRCGDGIVDSASGEDCDDQNDVPGDGCEPGCTFTCSEDADCDDMFPCNGAETCNLSLHRCQAGEPENGGDCTLEDESEGVCSGGLCASPGCGNLVPDAGEDCDDGQNGDNDDGCRDDCTFTCTMDEDCQNGDVCDGTETCNTLTHTCEAPESALDCDDGDPCTADSCDSDAGCANEVIDVDGDGYSPGTCTTAGLMGGDCDDTNSAVYPDAPEACDSVDNDCNGMVDDDTVTITCYRDQDGDGFGVESDSVMGCSCPAGYVPERSAGFDCEDVGRDAPNIYPGNTNWYTDGYCPNGATLCARADLSYDYDCDGDSTKRYTVISSGSCGYTCTSSLCYCGGSGWTGTTVPGCGNDAQYRSCRTLFSGCSGGTGDRTQTCR